MIEQSKMTYLMSGPKVSRLARGVCGAGVLVILCAAELSAQVGKIPEGFTAIFNGKDLKGWHISRINHHGTTPNWYVEGGVLVGKENPISEGGILLTDKRYKDFELYLEIKPDWGCDGGVFLRSTEGGSAYQVNIMINKAQTGGAANAALIGEKLRVSQGAHADWQKVWRKDDWNSIRIRMTGDVPRITLWLNDQQMWDVTELTNDLIGDATDGMIALQVHWSEAGMPNWRPNGAHRFRNIAIKEIEEATYLNSIGMEFVRIPAGSVLMGKFQPTCPAEGGKVEWTPEDFVVCRELAKRDARPGFTVEIRRPFYMARYEVTQAQWKKVMGSNPSVFQGNKVKDDADLHPVDSVTWQDAQAFIKKLNAMEQTTVYRLPSEAEWEYAARAGATEELPREELAQYAWQSGSYAPLPRPANPDTSKVTTHVVGQKRPNAWGLYDMLGNVWEWVQDYYNEQRLPSPTPVATGKAHVLRGGSFLGDRKNVRFSEHAGGPGSGLDVGFRIVREAK